MAPPRTGVELPCKQCGSPFYVNRYRIEKGNPQFCSPECQGRGTRKRETVPCANCRNDFELTPSEMKRKKGQNKFCSQTCNRAYWQRQIQARKIPCEHCGELKNVYPYQAETLGTEHYFCSRACKHAWQDARRPEAVCKMCGVTFRRSASHMVGAKYCGTVCRDADPEVQEQLRRQNAELQQRTEPTSIESMAYRVLEAMGVVFVRQELVNGKFLVDAWLPSERVAVEVDGCYWHGHGCNPGMKVNAEVERSMRGDRAEAGYFKKCGIGLVRIWECEIRENPDLLRQRIEACMDDQEGKVTPNLRLSPAVANVRSSRPLTRDALALVLQNHAHLGEHPCGTK